MKVAPIFQNQMVLQGGKEICIWGTGVPGEHITVRIQKREAETLTGKDGRWQVTLPKLYVSEDETMIVKSNYEERFFYNIAIGEVWIAGGQSNMEFYMKFEKHYSEELDHLSDKIIRFYDMPQVAYDGQTEDFEYEVPGVWRKADHENLLYFSAVGYYFGKKLAERKNIPVGIIGCNWSGTRSCSWMSWKTAENMAESWITYTKEQLKNIPAEVYWKKQRGNPMNNRGNNLRNPFVEFMMPRTPSDEEIAAFMKNLFGGNHSGSGADNNEMPLPELLPGSLYEHMVKILAPYTVRGVLWYQGESDDINDLQVFYKDMLAALIADWRKLWKEQLPFLIVQLPGFLRWLDIENHHFDIIRKCQEEVTKTVSDTWLCSISDSGEKLDIHPKNKKVAGERLALLALGHIYGENILCDPPKPKEIQIKEKSIVITFENTGNGLVIDGDKLEAMKVILGQTEMLFESSVSGNQMIMEMEKPLKENITILFAQDRWYKVNLYNSAGIPAIPFRYEDE